MITLSVGMDYPTLQDEVWAKLTESGSVRMPLALAFWGARFGMLTDRFGIPWMLNCEVERKP